jgi:hypothetical protein
MKKINTILRSFKYVFEGQNDIFCSENDRNRVND